MYYARGAGLNSEKECLPGTRTQALDEITEWINRVDDERRVYILHGAAGTGKSAIAHTIAGRFQKLGRLGSCFCFDCNFRSERRTNTIFSTISRNLADLDSRFKERLWQGIHADRGIRTSSDLKVQWENFILNPVKELMIAGPVVIVIDALDESGDVFSRLRLLEFLSKHLTELPSNFRIFITSRSEKDIVDAFEGEPRVICTQADQFSSSTKQDIISYIRYSIAPYKHLKFIGENELSLLADMSEGVFQWASTFCKEMVIGKPGLSPRKLYGTFTSLHNNSGPLDALYRQILEMNFDAKDKDVLSEFKSVMGQLMATFEPLSITSLAEMRRQYDPGAESEDESREAINAVVKYMGSLLSGVAEESTAIRPFHTSFRDFLADQERSLSFYINISEGHSILALSSLRIMKTLHFNICHLETTFLSNKEIPDLAARVSNYISPPLSYSCRFWASHFEGAIPDSALHKELARFLYTSLLFWAEVLSLLGAYHISYVTLDIVTTWCRVGVKLEN